MKMEEVKRLIERKKTETINDLCKSLKGTSLSHFGPEVTELVILLKNSRLISLEYPPYSEEGVYNKLNAPFFSAKLKGSQCLIEALNAVQRERQRMSKP